MYFCLRELGITLTNPVSRCLEYFFIVIVKRFIDIPHCRIIIPSIKQDITDAGSETHC